MFSIYLIVFYVLLLALKPTRKVALALTPWLLFACSYDWMRLMPNYKVNPIDVKGIFEAEKELFGITVGNETLIPGAYLQMHHNTFADIMAGLFYLCWVPVPLAFAIYLYFKGDRRNYLRFSWCFLFVNLLGFCGYYSHPAAPPWYALNYGFDPILNTPGNTAGLQRFDDLTGLPIFQSLYGKNANVFAAVPSLHAAYMLIATVYSIISRQKKWLTCAFAIICIGIWWTAVYTTHHYIIDVLLGIVTAFAGIFIFEKCVLRLRSLCF